MRQAGLFRVLVDVYGIALVALFVLTGASDLISNNYTMSARL